VSRSALLLLIAILVSGGLDAQQTFRGVSSQASAGMGEIELAGCTVDLRVPFSPSAAHPFFPVMVRFANKGANTRTVTFTIESGDQWGSIGREVIPYRVRRELTLSPGAEQLQWVPMPTPAVGRYFRNYQLNSGRLKQRRSGAEREAWEYRVHQCSRSGSAHRQGKGDGDLDTPRQWFRSTPSVSIANWTSSVGQVEDPAAGGFSPRDATRECDPRTSRSPAPGWGLSR